jgi:GxxExxY protein
MLIHATDLLHRDLTQRIVNGAIAVHRELGPGLLEGAYRACLVHELGRAGLDVAVEVPVPIQYRGLRLDCGYRADVVVDDRVVLELKAVERLLPIHDAQLLTYLKLSGLRVGMLMNFNARTLKDGLRRLAR